MLLTSFDMSARMHYLNARQTLRRLLDWRVVPVVNENDTTATDEITFGDNDFLSAQVAILLEARLLVLLTDTAGLHTADPRRAPDAELVEEVKSFGELARYEIGDRTSAFGSGGMRSKVAAAEMASAAGIPVVVCDGTETGSFAAAARGERVGTRFAPHPERTPSFKLWLRYAKPSQGRVVVDEGAARVLRERGSSLLPVGITESRGRVRGRRRGGGGLRRRGGRQGHRQLLRRRARPDQGPEVRAGAGADAERLRGGGAPRLLRADLARTGQAHAVAVRCTRAPTVGHVDLR